MNFEPDPIQPGTFSVCKKREGARKKLALHWNRWQDLQKHYLACFLYRTDDQVSKVKIKQSQQPKQTNEVQARMESYK